jgi:uncharacterized protein YvpB
LKPLLAALLAAALSFPVTLAAAAPSSPILRSVAQPTAPAVTPVRSARPAPAPAGLRPVGETAARLAALTPTATPLPPTASPTSTATPSPTGTVVEMPTFSPSKDAVRGYVDGTRLLLEVPIRSQFDGTEFQSSNCGPTSIAMVLDAFGVSTKTFQVRNLANVLRGSYDPEQGISLDNLAWIANQAGLRPIGLYADAGYRRWTVEELRHEVRHGHPVITLVKYRDLPDARVTLSESDHYVVVVGLDGPNLLINDPAMPAELGYRRPLTPAELEVAWADSSIPRHALAFAATDNVRELDLPNPTLPAYLGDGTRDDWRIPLAADLVELSPMVWPTEPSATLVVAPIPLTPIPLTPEPVVPAPDPMALAKMSPLEPGVGADAPASAPPAPTPAGDLGLLSLLSLPLFFLRSAGRLPG